MSEWIANLPASNWLNNDYIYGVLTYVAAGD